MNQIRKSPVGILALAVFFLASCGGGGGSSTPSPSGLQYPSHSAYVVQQAITPLTPTVSGQPTDFSVSPTLPAGLTLNSATGVISGTPTVIAASASYTVTAANMGGSTTATVTIAVNDIAPTIAYPSPYYAFTANVQHATTIKPKAGGGAITSWSVTPALPAGLTLSTTDGTISGIPTAASAPTTYTVTAGNSGGSTTDTLTIAVAAAPLLDQGHYNRVTVIRASGSRLLSWGLNHWLLQDYATGTHIAAGDYECDVLNGCRNNVDFQHTDPVDIEGGIMLDPLSDGVELRSVTDGHLLSKISGQTFGWWQLASDGSYLAGGNLTALTVWNSSGQVLLSKPGNYHEARVFAAPGQLLVANGASGQNVIETIAVATGTSTLSPVFQGGFATWFPDGTRFLSTQGGTLWTYSSSAVQQDVAQLADPNNALTVHGTGNYVWTFDTFSDRLNIYPVGATSAAPVFTATYGSNATAVSSGNTIAALPWSSPQITTIDLSGATPVATNVTLPVSTATAYVQIPGGGWVVGNTWGVLVDGATVASNDPRFLAVGRAWSIAGGSNYVSVATAAGRIFTYDSNNTLVSTIKFPAIQLASSSSGAVLAAFGDSSTGDPPTLKVYSSLDGTVTASYQYTPLYDTLNNALVPLQLSAAGDVLLAPLVNPSGCEYEAVTVASGAPLWCGTSRAAGSVALSPDGTLISIVTGANLSQTSTAIYKNGTLSAAVAADGVGWLDNNRLLGSLYDRESHYTNSTIYDSAGHVLSSFTLPPINYPRLIGFGVVSSDSIYVNLTGAIYSLTDGGILWTTANLPPGGGAIWPGAVSGSQIIFVSGTQVLAQPH